MGINKLFYNYFSSYITMFIRLGMKESHVQHKTSALVPPLLLENATIYLLDSILPMMCPRLYVVVEFLFLLVPTFTSIILLWLMMPVVSFFNIDIYEIDHLTSIDINIWDAKHLSLRLAPGKFGNLCFTISAVSTEQNVLYIYLISVYFF